MTTTLVAAMLAGLATCASLAAIVGNVSLALLGAGVALPLSTALLVLTADD